MRFLWMVIWDLFKGLPSSAHIKVFDFLPHCINMIDFDVLTFTSCLIINEETVSFQKKNYPPKTFFLLLSSFSTIAANFEVTHFH